ncbi:periplasmic heavy metal sensor [Novosphingobium sp.]|uniref:periplasmic heavy metal sensor n=1 Tax=Novosphingobium sp. TaxID=1874826 RepID=UPI003B526CCC
MNRLRIAVCVSVVLNVFLAGALIAGFFAVRNGGRMINAGALRIAGSELPAAERRPFRHALREARNAMGPSIAESHRAKQQAALLLRQPNVDQGAVMVALDQARADDMAVRAAVERRAVAFAATLPGPDRAKLANAIDKRAGQGPDLQKARDGKTPGPR